jgi:hypothetical protein
MLITISATAAAQGRIVAPANPTPDFNRTSDPMLERMGRDPAFYSRSVTGAILKLDNNAGVLMIGKPDKSELAFVVDDKARLKADRETSLAGRKDLSLSDYRPGQTVKVVYRVADNKVLELRLKRPKN